MGHDMSPGRLPWRRPGISSTGCQGRPPGPTPPADRSAGPGGGATVTSWGVDGPQSPPLASRENLSWAVLGPPSTLALDVFAALTFLLQARGKGARSLVWGKGSLGSHPQALFCLLWPLPDLVLPVCSFTPSPGACTRPVQPPCSQGPEAWPHLPSPTSAGNGLESTFPAFRNQDCFEIPAPSSSRLSSPPPPRPSSFAFCAGPGCVSL